MPAVGAAHVAAFKRGHRNLPMPAGGNQALSVTYPTSHLRSRVEIALGADLTQPPTTWQWADITDYVRHASGITVSTGRKDEHALVEAGTGELTLDNRDGGFSRRNPASPYYPLLTKNTPIRASVDPGSGFVTRMEMFVNNWPNRSDIAGVDVTMPISCAGVLRRLGQGSVAISALRRTIQGATATAPTFYWPLEVGSDVQTAFAASATGAALTVHDNDYLSSGALADGSANTPVLECFAAAGGAPDSAAGFSSPSIAAVGASGFTVAIAFRGDILTATTAWQLLRLQMAGGSIGEISALAYQATTSGVPDANFGIDIQLVGPTGASIGNIANAFGQVSPFDGDAHVLTLTFAQSGSDTTCTATVDGVAFVNSFPATGTGLTLGTPGTLRFGDPWAVAFGGSDAYSNVGTALTVGHLAVWGPTAPSASSLYNALVAYPGEQAHVRIMRLCTEAGLPVRCFGAKSTQMGPQPNDTLINILRDAEAVDLGVLYETGFGLGYQCRTERYNAPVALALDFAQGQIADPPAHEDDDIELRNRWTVTRKTASGTGAEVTVEDAANIAANGLYDDSAEVNLYTDDQLPNAASWRLHLGTVDVERWPSLTLDFASTPDRAVIPSWLAVGFGARVQVANPPDAYSPESVDAFVEGWTEKWDPISWDVEFNTSPASPHSVHVVGSTTDNQGRVDSASSTLTADPGTAGTTLTVATTGVRWIDSATYPSLFPFDIDLTGERVTVTAISGTTSLQTFTVTRSVNGVVLAHAARTTVRLWKPPVYAM